MAKIPKNKTRKISEIETISLLGHELKIVPDNGLEGCKECSLYQDCSKQSIPCLINEYAYLGYHLELI